MALNFINDESYTICVLERIGYLSSRSENVPTPEVTRQLMENAGFLRMKDKMIFNFNRYKIIYMASLQCTGFQMQNPDFVCFTGVHYTHLMLSVLNCPRWLRWNACTEDILLCCKMKNSNKIVTFQNYLIWQKCKKNAYFPSVNL